MANQSIIQDLQRQIAEQEIKLEEARRKNEPGGVITEQNKLASLKRQLKMAQDEARMGHIAF